jgi:hypothetical protein
MYSLIDKMYEMLNLEDCNARLYAENRFTELLTFSSFDEIVELLDDVDNNYNQIEIPVWTRILAYRLAYLQRPNDTDFMRRVILWLRLYGPDWDAEADKLETKLKKLESVKKS